MKHILFFLLVLLSFDTFSQISDPNIRKAKLEIEKKNYEKAIELCDIAISDGRYLAEAYAWKATIYMDLENYKEAKVLLNLAISYKSNYNFALTLLEIVNKKIIENNSAENVTHEKEYIRKVETTSNNLDTSIPFVKENNVNSFALIIGNENYQKEIDVKYAINDATIFKKYLVNTLGLPSKNIHILENATYGEILDEISWISNIIKVFNGKAKVIFYYAGHGIPDEKSKSSYILPVDGNSKNTNTAISLDNIYANLTEHETSSVTVFLDACFSGAVRSNNVAMLDDSRGVRIKPKENILKGNIVVFSATSGDETAFPIDEYKHGLFTYYLLKKLQESKGELTYLELYEFINTNVSQQSIIINNKLQTPQIRTSFQFNETWKDLKF